MPNPAQARVEGPLGRRSRRLAELAQHEETIAGPCLFRARALDSLLERFPLLRDVSLGEDASGVSQRGAAQVLACLRNLVLGVDELARAWSDPRAKARARRMTFSAAWRWLGR